MRDCPIEASSMHAKNTHAYSYNVQPIEGFR